MIRALVLALLLAAPVAQAQDRRPTPYYVVDTCDQGGGYRDTIRCIASYTQEEDARLNENYRAAMSRLRTPREKIALRDVQRAWIKDRDASCRPYLNQRVYGREGGVEHQRCLYDATQVRADELDRYGRPRPR